MYLSNWLCSICLTGGILSMYLSNWLNWKLTVFCLFICLNGCDLSVSLTEFCHCICPAEYVLCICLSDFWPMYLFIWFLTYVSVYLISDLCFYLSDFWPMYLFIWFLTYVSVYLISDLCICLTCCVLSDWVLSMCLSNSLCSFYVSAYLTVFCLFIFLTDWILSKRQGHVYVSV